MYKHLQPYIGLWYKSPDINEIFEIVAIDNEDSTIEIQYFDGSLEEIDFDIWKSLHASEIAAPEDWSGPYEMNKEDLSYLDEIIHPHDWSGPLSHIESDIIGN